MKWNDSAPILLLGCTLCLSLGYFIGELLPDPIFLGVSLTFNAAVAVYCVTDFKRKFPDCNSKIGYAILSLIFVLAYAIAQTTL